MIQSTIRESSLESELLSDASQSRHQLFVSDHRSGIMWEGTSLRDTAEKGEHRTWSSEGPYEVCGSQPSAK